MKKQKVIVILLFAICFVCGCGKIMKIEESVEKDYQIVKEDEIPEKMKSKIEEMKTDSFQITYEEEGVLYIGQGYGEKMLEGYEITVDKCTESEHFLYVHTILHGPKVEGEEEKSWPYIVIKTEGANKQVVFLNE